MRLAWARSTRRLLVPWSGDALAAEARDFLAKTADLVSSLFAEREDLAGLLGDLVAREVPGVWPRAPDGRWLFDLFRATPLLDGLALDLGPTPRSLGASSFVRGLARFGAAYARSAVVQSGAFVVANDPSDAHALRRGALFASLLLDPVFLRKKMGLSREAAAKTARHLACARARPRAARGDANALDFATAAPGEFEEAASDALKVRVPQRVRRRAPSPRPARPCSAGRRARSLPTIARTCEATSTRIGSTNPRAMSFLRETDASPRPFHLPAEGLRGAADRLAKNLEEVAG